MFLSTLTVLSSTPLNLCKNTTRGISAPTWRHVDQFFLVKHNTKLKFLLSAWALCRRRHEIPAKNITRSISAPTWRHVLQFSFANVNKTCTSLFSAWTSTLECASCFLNVTAFRVMKLCFSSHFSLTTPRFTLRVPCNEYYEEHVGVDVAKTSFRLRTNILPSYW